MKAFLDRNCDISLRTPQSTSTGRAIDFNNMKVVGFYDCLSSIIFSDNTRLIPSSQMTNVNESCHTICRKLTKPKVLLGNAINLFLPLPVLNM
ncbi:hypothetical protein LSH36_590g00008 [Paralvinella palmiformis]|uniref:Uncharacterized protein n=1 Tax=Paralvinella palmiformis TaxID=53620 RepID=A0AAD9MXK1_9ANNE|nr:hypothetical protein LSH36_590g00008 [Paralvinella palmiformis]